MSPACLLERVVELSNAINHDADLATRLHRANANRGAAGNDVTDFKSDVLGNQAHQFGGLENHIGNWIILALLIVQDRFNVQLAWVDASSDVGAKGAKGIKAL